jgi:hypothetical protein
MIWGGIYHDGKKELITLHDRLNAISYCDEIILSVIVPYILNSNSDVLQQDNARCHNARHTQNVLVENNINMIELPAKSPDLSPIEHTWDYLGRKLRDRNDVNRHLFILLDVAYTR